MVELCCATAWLGMGMEGCRTFFVAVEVRMAVGDEKGVYE